jgi:hypothetical protein
MAGAEPLPTVLVALDKYDFMILLQALALVQEKHPNFWSSDEAADLASIRTRISDAAKSLPPATEGAAQ